MIAFLWFTFLLFRLAWTEESNKTYSGTYVIVAPNTIRPGLPYSVAVSILQSQEPVNVELIIQDDQNKTVLQTSQSNIKPGEPAVIKVDKIPVDLMDTASYQLRARGVSSKNKRQLFDETKPIQIALKSFSTFIQTDKATYKPGAKVQFRIVAVDPDLKPIKGFADVKVKDPQQNVIKQFSAQIIDKGVVGKNGKLSFELSDEPVLGTWTISVEINGQTNQKSFEVEKYVLPKFDVQLELPSFILINQDYEFNVTAKYTYGKGVVGNAHVRVSTYFDPTDNMTSIVKTLELDKYGRASLRITNKELRANHIITNRSSESAMIVETSVTETLSGSQINATSLSSIYTRPYQINVLKTTEMFHPGMDFQFKVRVSTHDDKPLPVTDIRPINVSIIHNFPGTYGENDAYVAPSVESHQMVTLNADGVATVSIKTLVNATSMNIKAKYADELYDDSGVGSELSVSPVKSPTDSYLQIEHGDIEKVKIGDTLIFSVKTNANLKTITVQVMTKGNIVSTRNIQVGNNVAEVKIQATPDMTPESQVIVYGIQEKNKEIVVDAVQLRIDGIFRNNVSIDANPKRVEPNATVTLKVKSSPKSYVGLLAIDKSVILLRSGNDITISDVESEMASYGSGYNSAAWRPDKRRRNKRSSYWWPVFGEDASSIFANAGVLVITDALLYGDEPIEHSHFYPEVGGPVANGPMAPILTTSPGLPSDANKDLAKAKSTTTSSAQAPEPVVRSKFLETWIWADLTVGENGEAVYTAEAPDTITSFVATTFAIHDTEGLAVASEAVNVEVFRPFFIRLDLPYSAKRGEKLALHVIIFNYGNTEQSVTVTLDHDDQSGFDFIEKSDKIKNSKDKDKPSNIRLVRVPGNGGSASVFFPIRLTKIGNVKLLVKASGQGVSDALENNLLVEAEGYALYFNKPLQIDVGNDYSGSNATKLDFPPDIVPGSQKVHLTIVGDMMAPLLNNIGNLIQMPSGCGEQNMLNFVPNIVVNQYLKATNRLTPYQAAQTVRYMELGYQKELTYQRDDNSFSAFGKQDANGSTWLTAFVVKSFAQAKPLIFIDEEMLSKSLDFLQSKMKENGVFEENGEVHDKEMQGGSGESSVAATAYVFISLLMNNRSSPETLAFLERSLDRISNNSYALAITCYALHLAGSSKKDEALKMLEKLAIKKDKLTHWSKTVSDDIDKLNYRNWWYRPRPADIETTSYALLTYGLRNDLIKAVSLFRWLSQQQNGFGGFSSTQDTVVALQAIGQFAEKIHTGKMNLTVAVQNGNKTFSIPITYENSLIQQTFLIPNVNDPINVKTSGHGSAFGQISWHYNIANLENVKPFTCTRDVHQITVNDLNLSLRCKYNLKGNSNMAVMEVDALSGFSIDVDKLNQLVTTVDQVQRVEIQCDNSQANIYFTSLNTTGVCFDVSFQRYYGLMDQKPAVVKLYDYYNPSERTEFDYDAVLNATLKDVCGPYCWTDSSANVTLLEAQT